MRLITICKKCKKEIAVRSCASDRGELAREKGKVFVLKCKHCQHEHVYNINEVKATVSHLLNLTLLLVAISISSFIGIYLFQNYWGKSIYLTYAIPVAIAIPLIIYSTFINSQNKKLRIFNSWRTY